MNWVNIGKKMIRSVGNAIKRKMLEISYSVSLFLLREYQLQKSSAFFATD